MAKTAAERQAIYKKKRDSAGKNGDGERRINTWVSTSTVSRLERLARRYCVTNKEMLEKLIEIADKDIRSTLDIDTSEWDAYYGITQQFVVI
jgi:hypothetical protein